MCYQLIELFSACRCLYYQHPIDRCADYGSEGHIVNRRTVYVGVACPEHFSPDHRHDGQYSFLEKYCQKSMLMPKKAARSPGDTRLFLELIGLLLICFSS